VAALTFDVGAATPVVHASYHAPPFGRHRRADEAERVLAIMTRPDTRPPGLIAGDWNSVSADRVFLPEREVYSWLGTLDDVEPARWALYDHDPYNAFTNGKRATWHGDLVYQTTWAYDGNGERSWAADREPGEVLYAGGLRDVAAALGVPWEPTTGHWPENDPYPPRRIDATRVTSEVTPALTGCEVLSTDLARAASDHLPFVTIYDPAAIATREA
jgi:endonuclease/exonuclease/phosphatase family metal-dependent hydrolase